MLKLLLTFTLSFSLSIGLAQIEKIDTDRPDQTESPSIVPKKWVQLEMGFMKESSRFNDTKDLFFQHPTLLSKYGLAKCFEFRLITSFATYRIVDNNKVVDRKNGISDVQFGGKVNFFSEKGLRPKTSLIAHYDFGRLRSAYKDSVDGLNFRFTMQHTLTKTMGLGYNLGMEWGRFDEEPAYIYTLAPGMSIGENWYAYIELFGSIWKSQSPEHSADGGVAFYVTDNFKLDVSAGFGISKAAPDWYAAIGASFRFNTGK